MEKGKYRPEVASLLGINSENRYWGYMGQALCLKLKCLKTKMVFSSVECKYIYCPGHLRGER